MVRSGDSYSSDKEVNRTKQVEKIAHGFQMIQTDYPWDIFYDTGPSGVSIPTDPSRRFRVFDRGRLERDGAEAAEVRDEMLIEPGIRFYFSIGDAMQYAYSLAPTQSDRLWETTVSTTRNGETWEGLVNPGVYPRRANEDGAGCIKAEDQFGAQFMTICRWKATQPGDSAFQEKVGVTVAWNQGGQVESTMVEADRYHTAPVGNLIALHIENQGSQSLVTALSSGKLDHNWHPIWKVISAKRFGIPLVRQGLAANKDVLFVGSRIQEGIVPARPVTICDISTIEGSVGPKVVIADLSFPIVSDPQCVPHR
jgi:hypothetical protein